MTPNRISGLLVAIIGLVLLFWIIPRHTEAVDSGWLRPATLPTITAVIVIVTSIIQVLFPTGKVEFDVKAAVRAGFFFAISLLSVYLMHIAGFLIAAPVMIAVLMLLIG